MNRSSLPQRLRNSLFATGETQRHFAECAGSTNDAVSKFIKGTLKRGQEADKIVSEMERRSWTTGPIAASALSEREKTLITHCFNNSDLPDDMKDELLFKVLSAFA